MRLRINRIGTGPGPGEIVISVTTSLGTTEQVVVHTIGIENDTIEVGYPIVSEQNRILIELPRESVSGKWRLWVPTLNVVEA